jgi:beta-galactosidase
MTIELVREGLSIDGEVVPLLVGSVHYWRLDPAEWRACLEGLRALGLRFVDTYVPWGVHELSPGRFDFGTERPELDLARFLRLADEVGLYCIVRPGPHINAELTWFGLPERIVWDSLCQAKSPTGNPVFLPMLPLGFPVPSYASRAFFDETSRWYRAMAGVVAPFLHPKGRVVLVQADNEGALYFRDGVYEQDYHPDAIALYRDFLREKYKTLEALEAAYGPIMAGRSPDETPGDGALGDGSLAEPLTFATIEPPRELDLESKRELVRHLDWAELQEHLLEVALLRFATLLREAGIVGVPLSHNLPPGQDATPLNAARVSRSIELVGLDYYQSATPTNRRVSMRRTTELVARCDATGKPPFACEMGAGFPPFFPPLDERDSAFCLLTALAYGLRGYNLYMAVERDRWIGAPIDPHGRLRPFSELFRKLSAGLVEVGFFSLRRRVPVRVVVPRSERRLSRVLHAFGPVPGAFFSVAGATPRERCLELELDGGGRLVHDADTFALAVEAALEVRGVPFAVVGGEDRDVSLDGAKWIVCATSGGLSPKLMDALVAAAEGGAVVTLGPVAPTMDGTYRELAEPLALERLRPDGLNANYPRGGLGGAELAAARAALPLVCPADPLALDAAVADAARLLGLPSTPADPDTVFVTVHEDAAGRPRVVFLINPGEHDVVARASIPGLAPGAQVTDLLTKAELSLDGPTLEARVPAKTVRVLSV